jgi:hypothetical protein
VSPQEPESKRLISLVSPARVEPATYCLKVNRDGVMRSRWPLGEGAIKAIAGWCQVAAAARDSQHSRQIRADQVAAFATLAKAPAGGAGHAHLRTSLINPYGLVTRLPSCRKAGVFIVLAGRFGGWGPP